MGKVQGIPVPSHMSVHDRRALESRARFEREDDARTSLGEQQRGKEAFFAEVEGIVRAGRYDAACAKCGSAGASKRFCSGREPNEGLEAQCLVIGPHLHAQCGSCGRVWLERCKDDELDDDDRGALRPDERIVDGKLERHELPTAAQRWGIEVKPE